MANLPDTKSFQEEKNRRAEHSVQEGVRAGIKAAAIAAVAAAVPTLIAVRKVPWAKANLNYTAQALIISGVQRSCQFLRDKQLVIGLMGKNDLLEVYDYHITNLASISAYFITVDKAILASARRNTRAQYDRNT